jgi:nicotinamidase-related amidase
MPELDVDKTTTALVVIDLQKGIAAQPIQPYPAQDVIRNSAKLIKAFRKNGMPVFLVHVVATQETMLNVNSDLSFSRPVPLPPEWSEFVPEIAPFNSDNQLQLFSSQFQYDVFTKDL